MRFLPAPIKYLAAASLALASTLGHAAATPQQTRAIAKEAFIYAYPMLFNYKTMYGGAINAADPEYGGFGKFKHYSQPYTAANTDIITPNNDTPYSWGWLDLRAEPWVLSLPAVPKDRYNVFQFFDLYTYNFAYVGVRATGFGAGSYLFAGPHWRGKMPAGIARSFQSETDFVGILGRTSLSGPEDAANVEALQAQYKLEPLSAYVHRTAPAPAKPVDWPVWDEKKALSPEFISYLNLLLQYTQPVVPSEKALMQRFSQIGIAPGKPFNFASLPAATQTALTQGVADGMAELQQAEKTSTSSTGVFGTRADLNNDYLKRAIGAAIGIYGNSAVEAVYEGYHTDASGKMLDGSKKYVLHLGKEQLPPVQFFWSMTMYDLPGRHLVANPINRYSIGDRTPGLKYGADGSLDIYIQPVAPEGGLANNWLPSPQSGPYNVIMRLYGPSADVIAGKWKLPAVQEVAN